MSVSAVTIFPERRGTQTCVCIGSYISFTKQKQNKTKNLRLQNGHGNKDSVMGISVWLFSGKV